MILDLNKNITTLKGQETDEKMSDILALVISSSNVGNPIKLMKWAYKLSDDGSIDVTASDKELLLNLVENTQSITNIAKYQIMQELEKL